MKVTRNVKKTFSDFSDIVSSLGNKSKKSLKYFNFKLLFKGFAIICLSVFLLYDSVAWFYKEYVSRGTELAIGDIAHLVRQYNASGVMIQDDGIVQTLIEEDDISIATVDTRYIEITNTGSLDMEYNITFQLDGSVSDAGILFYRIYEVTDEVLGTTIAAGYNTKLKTYANINPTPANLEFDTAIPVSNLSTISNIITTGEIEKDTVNDENNVRYYRVDYGMYQGANSSAFSGSSVAVHTTVYSSQMGVESLINSEGEIWEVESEAQFRNAVVNALSGDTIKLMTDITINGTIDFARRVHLDTNEHALTITGDLIYDFVELGILNIDASGNGTIDVDGNLSIIAPKSKIHMYGDNNGYDVYVGGTFTVNGLQNEEEDGVLLEGIRIVKNKIGNIPVDLVVMSNTRLTIAPDVVLGFIIAYENSTNIEIINNGSIVQIQLQDMDLLESFSKPQIYIYNLNIIQGVTGTGCIIVPANSTPYLGPNNGNTLIIKGITSSDITVSGSTNFNQTDIGYSEVEDSVIPIIGEANAYIVYIREPAESLRQLLIDYFTINTPDSVMGSILDIDKLVIYTVNAQYIENEDFTFLNSTEIQNLTYLGLSGASVKDNNTINKIPDGAMSNASALKTLILPSTITQIGVNAFTNSQLGYIPSSAAFTFLKIPASVTSIGAGAFTSSKYVKFEGLNPPVVGVNAFNNSATGVRYFVPANVIANYQNTNNIDPAYVHIDAILSDNRNYFVYTNGEGIGISYYISNINVGNTLAIPNTLLVNNVARPINAIGVSAFRHITTPSTGVAVTLPTTVTTMGDYAFYNKKINSINIPNVTTIGKYAFYNTNLMSVVANAVTDIGEYAFYNSTLRTASFRQLLSLGTSAFENNITLYEIDLGLVKVLGDRSLYNCVQLGSVHFRNTDAVLANNAEIIDLVIGTDAIFSDWGMYLDGRLRVYVPYGTTENGNRYIDLYKAAFTGNEDYVYFDGIVVGNYTHVAIPYNFGIYTVRDITLTNYLNEQVDGYEIISYQGKDLDEDYVFPSTLTVNGVEKPVISIGEYAYYHSIVGTGETVDIESTNLIQINKYGMYALEIHSLIADSLLYLREYALYGSHVTHVSFGNLNTAMTHSLGEAEYLYSANLGNVKTIGSRFIENSLNLEQIFMTNIDLSGFSISSNAFVNIGTNASARLRIYVPSGATNINYYKQYIFPNQAEYVYEKGILYGSFINLPIPYNIQTMSVKVVTLTNMYSQSVTGWEIIEYHGENLSNTYSIGDSLTIGQNTYDIISIGERAYVHATGATGITISQNNIITIGKEAFKGLSAIKSFTGNSVIEIGAGAFDGSSIVDGTFINLRVLKTLAFANTSELVHLNLGTVTNIEEYTIYNAAKLSQVFFNATTTNIDFDANAIGNVGSATMNRIRLYVTDATAGNGLEYVDIYKGAFTAALRPYFYPRGTIMGSYSLSNSSYDIGEYSIREITLTNKDNTQVSGYEMIEYHGADLTDSYVLPISLSNTNSGISAIITNTTYWLQGGLNHYTFDIKITNNKDVAITSWQFDVNTTDVTNNYNGGFVVNSNSTTITNASYNGSLGPGNSTDIQIKVATNVVYNPIITNVKEQGTNNSLGTLISVGNYAFYHVNMDTGDTFSISHNQLINIGTYAFYNLNGISSISASELVTIADYGLYGNQINVARFPALKVGGKYALSENEEMNYINLGTVNSIGEGMLMNNENIEQIFFYGTSGSANSNRMNIIIGTNAFYNIGITIGDRLRVYVPDGNLAVGLTYLEAYKNTLPTTLTEYIFPTGQLDESPYIFTPLTYNINQYMLREVTKVTTGNAATTGWEIVEYHGPDITSSYAAPSSFTVNGVTKNVISIGPNAFKHTKIATNAIWNMAFSDNVVYIGDYAFYRTNIKTVSGNRLTYVGQYSFADCEQLTTVNFNGMKEIANYAFYSNSRMTYIKIGDGVVSIGDYALYNPYYGDPNGNAGPTTTMQILNTSLPTVGTNAFPEVQSILWWTYTNFTISVPQSARSLYRNNSPWKNYTITSSQYSADFLYQLINNNEVQITSYLGTTNNLTIPTTLPVDGVEYQVTSIASGAFDSATSTSRITLSQYIYNIGNSFLAENTTITYIGVSSNNNFYATANGILTSKDGTVLIKYPNAMTGGTYNMNNSIKVIGSSAFQGSMNLQQIRISSAIEVIASNAFNNCASLTTITFQTDAPYFTAFDICATGTTLLIRVPSAYYDNYYANVYLYQYRGNLRSY